jgi:hypothetical protein
MAPTVGYSVASRRKMLTHQVESILDWGQGRHGAQWVCGNRANRVVLPDTPDPNAQLCPRCFGTPSPGLSVVYFLRRPDGTIKIGTTTQLEKRIAALGGALLGWQPGGLEVERTLHLVFADDLVPTCGRECFVPSDRLTTYIERIAA